MANSGEKTITCFFFVNSGVEVYSKKVNSSENNCEVIAIQQIIEEHNLNPYDLSFVIDDNDKTYQAEYLMGLQDFQARKHLI